MGCLRSILLLGLVAAAIGAGWFLRDRWEGGDRLSSPATNEEAVWEPVTPEGAERARLRVEQLADRETPGFVTVGPGDLTAYIIEELSKQLPPSAEDAEAAVIRDRLHVRASIRLTDFGGERALGPLAGIVGDREQVQFSGTLEYLRREMAQYRVRSLRIRDLELPAPLIPRLVRNITRGDRPAILAEDALPLAIPDYIGDIRVAGGRILVYGKTE